MANDSRIPSAAELRARAQSPRPKPFTTEDVQRRFHEIANEVITSLGAPKGSGLREIRIGPAQSYPGNGTAARPEDFGADYAAAQLIVEELESKGYKAKLEIRENCRIAPLREDDCLFLVISW